jgi:DNA-binding transcriptional ArsR family regulator
MLCVVVSVFELISDPTRRRVLELLRAGERTVGALVLELGMEQPTVSKHLRVLREAGAVDVRVDGRLRWYRLRPGPLQELDRWLAPVRADWTDDRRQT